MRSDPSLTGNAGAVLNAPAHWRAVDVVSDLHLDVGEAHTAQAFADYLAGCDADALIILGDFFEVWVGDDVLSADVSHGPEAASRRFVQDMCTTLRRCADQRPVYVMHGNRDFLYGRAFTAFTHTQLLNDPAVLDWGTHRVVLTHGDAWCLEDRDYLAFRAEVRSAAWQSAFLARPLPEREALARDLRARSEARKRDPQQTWADVDTDTARHALQVHQASLLVHGHTHRPREHDLGNGCRRVVLSDWDADAQPPRAEVLRLYADATWQRRALLP